ncbi:MAG: hypothetical protein KF745_06820 [Phycisphaeraceae bacterium]|nr:hypothetical protein [Phycisphaeraceae bacterium]
MAEKDFADFGGFHSDDPGAEEPGPNDEGHGDEADAGDPMILIVVGAHIRAEVGDRPLAYRLRDRMIEWLSEHFDSGDTESWRAGNVGGDSDAGAEESPSIEVVVCTDVWYMNDAHLRIWPAVSLGGPGVNALSAYLGDKLPSVLVIDDVLMIQMDAAFEELTAAVWGVNHDATVAALDAFIERYLVPFLQAATRKLRGSHGA